MSVCLLIIDDGRGYLDGCLRSCERDLPPMDACVMVDDADHKLGFAGAIQAGWDGALESGCEFVFHLESDFRFEGPVPLEPMMSLARMRSDVTQVALKRQPVNQPEFDAGGIVEADPAAFEEREKNGRPYTVHRKFWTTNPSLYRTSLCERGWPQQHRSEGHFALTLFEESPHNVSAFWGMKFDPPRVRHIGKKRAGHGY